jgi:amino acid transporter
MFTSSPLLPFSWSDQARPQAFPRNGGEKNYLEHLFPRPRFLSTSVYAAFGTLLAYSAGNSLVFGEYILKAFSSSHEAPSPFVLKLTGFGCLTFTMLLHGCAVNWGLRLQNALGMFKIIVLVIVIGSGAYALVAGLGGEIDSTNGRAMTPWQKNFEHPFEGSTSSMTSFCLGLYNVCHFIPKSGLSRLTFFFLTIGALGLCRLFQR